MTKKIKANYQAIQELGRLCSGLDVQSFPDNWETLKHCAINQLQIDSRKVGKDDLFIAVKGFEADGHAYLDQAARQGALATVVEVPQPNLDLPQIVVADSRAAVADLASQYYYHPSRQLQLCGITGSNGKTSTSLLYRQIIQAAGWPCGLLGTVAYEDGLNKVTSSMTTPDALDLQRYLRNMVQEGYEHAVMEVSSIGLHQNRVRQTHFAQAALINLSHEHLDYHGSMEAYFHEKSKLLKGLDEDGVAVLNADDSWSISLQDQVSARVLRFGLSDQADVRAENLDLSTGFAAFDLCIKPENFLASAKRKPEAAFDLNQLEAGSYPVKLQVPGLHSVYNSLAAITLALCQGVSPDICAQAVASYQGVERRFQQVYSGDFRIFDDHFANTKNIDMTLKSLSEMDYKQLVMVYAIRGKRGPKVNRENIQTLNRWLPKLKMRAFIPSLSQDTVGHYDEVQAEEIAVFQEEMQQNNLSYTIYDQLEAALDQALDQVQPGDIILLAGCQGMDAGARLILHELAEQDPAHRAQILAPLQGRVCGW